MVKYQPLSGLMVRRFNEIPTSAKKDQAGYQKLAKSPVHKDNFICLVCRRNTLIKLIISEVETQLLSVSKLLDQNYFSVDYCLKMCLSHSVFCK